MTKTTEGERNTAFTRTVEYHRERLQRRSERGGSIDRLMRTALAAENIPPTGQSAHWYYDMIDFVPFGDQGTAWHVGRQLARLCGDDSEVTLTWDSLVDAVHRTDKLGRNKAFVQAGVAVLTGMGWLEKETVGGGRASRTTWRLMPGDRTAWQHLTRSPVMGSITAPESEPAA